MKNWIFWSGFACIIFTFFGTFVYLLYKDDVRRQAENQARYVWYQAHNCKAGGYVASRGYPIRIYKCDNGSEYTWYDIPME